MRPDPETTAPGRTFHGNPFNWYIRLIEFLAGTTMAIILVVMVVQVAARYLFAGSLIWAEEFCRYVLIWQTFLLLGIAYQRGEFVMLDILPYMLSRRARLVLKLVMAVPILIFLVVIVINGWDYASRFERATIPALDFISTSLTGRNLGVSVKWVYISVPVGAGLLALHVVADLVSSLLTFRRGDDLPGRPDQGEAA
jgi:TRAP-type C4-dicarboxylate transport system permease small subunit